MKLKYIFLAFAFFIAMFTEAQAQKVNYKFHSINTLSLLNGVSEVSAGLQSVNGFQKGNWFAGVGTGLDYYLYRTVPLFADLRYEFGKNKNNFFAYADGGLNIQWTQGFNHRYYIWDGSGTDNKFHNGVFTDFGMGYLVFMKKNNAMVLSLGHSHKSLKETSHYQDWRTQEWLMEGYNYNLNRVVIKIGWRF